VLLTMAKRLISLLSPLVLHIDFALEWIQVNAGQVIYHQNDPSDAIYIVLNGRVRTLTSTHEVVGEYGRGESVGELEVLTDQKRGIAVSVGVGCQLLNQERVLENLGRHAFNRMGKLKLAGYLGELEDKWDMVLYVADTGVNSPWTQTCISQVYLPKIILILGRL